MTHPNSGFETPAMPVATASHYVKTMVEREARGEGDLAGAIERIARRHGLTKWQVERLRKGRSKTIEAGLFSRIRAAYLAEVERQISKLEHELALERAIGGEDAALARAETAHRELVEATRKAKPSPLP